MKISKYKRFYLVCMTVVLFSVVTGSANAAKTRFADEVGTETLWKLSPADRVASEKARYPKNPSYPERMKFFFEDNRRTAKGVDMVFLGDSLTECFFIDEAFNGPLDADATRTIAVNRGISGDHIEGMIARLDVCVRDLQPKKLYFLGGGNDLWWVRNDYKDGNNGEGYRRLIHRVKELSPKTQIVVATCTPMNMYAEDPSSYPAYNKAVARASAQLRQVAKEENVEVVELGRALSDKNGYIIPRYTIDGTHLSFFGYLRWIDEIVPAGPEKMRIWRNLASKWATEITTTHTVDGVNIPRKENTLILYKRDGKTTSTGQTKGWGVEVQVVNDVVTSITRRGNMTIPENGVVLSGLKSTGDWLQNNANLGTRVKVTDTLVTADPKPTTTALEVYEAARGELMRAMAVGKTVSDDRYVNRLEAARRGDIKAGRAVLKELKKINGTD